MTEICTSILESYGTQIKNTQNIKQWGCFYKATDTIKQQNTQTKQIKYFSSAKTKHLQRKRSIFFSVR